MSTAQDTAIAFLLAQHVTEEAGKFYAEDAVRLTVVRNAPKKEKTAKVKDQSSKTETNDGSQAAPIPSASRPKDPSMALLLPPKGSLEAKGYLYAMRHGKDRNEKIQAIAAFIGWDPSLNFGAQEATANRQAARDIHGPVKPASPLSSREAGKSLTGYVSGMPDMTQRKVSHLLAQEREIVDLMLSHQKDSEDMTRSENERTLSLGLAQVEEQRLEHIRNELARLGM